MVSGGIRGLPLLTNIGIVCLGMLFPVTGTFNQSNPSSVKKSLVYTWVLAAVGGLFIGAESLGMSAPFLFIAFLFGAVGYTWFVNVLK